MSACKTPRNHATGDGIRRARASILLAALATFAAGQPAWSALQEATTSSDLPGGNNTTRSIRIADLDNDTFPDIVIANEATNQANQILWGDGSGGFEAATNLDGNMNQSDSVDMADVDGDGDLDIVIGNREAGAPARLYRNNGARSFTLLNNNAISNETAGRRTAEAKFGDLNNDGDPDVVIANRYQLNQVFLGDDTPGGAGFPLFGSLNNSGTTDSSSVAIGDLNDDGFPEIIVGNRENARNDLYINNPMQAGNIPFGVRRDLSPDLNYTDWVEIVDLNNDGWGDVIIGNREQPNQYLINNAQSVDNDNLFGPTRQISADADYTRELRAVDVDGDGDMDVIAANSSVGRSKVYLNLFLENGGTDVTFGPGIVFTNDATESTSLAICGPDSPIDPDCDIDGDGDNDVLTGNNGTPNRLHLNNNETPTFLSTPVLGATVGAAYEYTVIARDGDLAQALAITAPTVPGWLSIAAHPSDPRKAVLSGTPTVADTYNVSLDVSDGTANGTQPFTVTVAASNAAPTFTTAPGATLDFAQGPGGLTINLAATDAEDAAGDLVFSAPGRPSWLTLNANNGSGSASLTGNPGQNDIGVYELVVRVTDSGGRVDERLTTLTITDGNDRPVAGQDLICLASAGDTATVLTDDHPFYGVNTVLWNDFDPDGDDVSYVTTTVQPTAGTVTINGDGTFSYTHDGSATTQDQFRYRISDGNGATNLAFVLVRFNNDPMCLVGGDTTPPVITVDPAEVTILVGDTWDLAAALDGVAAVDNIDGDLSEDVVVGGDTVDTNTPGSYEVTYNVSDAAGNPAAEQTRTVIVSDNAVPEITILGDNPAEVSLGEVYEDAGATAEDAEDGDLTANIATDNPVNTDSIGTYLVTYSVMDSIGQMVSEVRTVNVVDSTAPVISITGNNPVTILVGGGYTDEGATALDNVDGDLTGDIVTDDTVDPDTIGSYTVTYTVSDAAGNEATATRTVNVVDMADTTPPVITLVGPATVTISVGGSYTEEGATATDDVEGDISDNVVIGGDTVDTSTAGTYVVTYNVSDSSGNAAEEVTRTVTVSEADDAAPVITITGSNPATVTQGNTYTDAGATANDAEDGDITADIDVDNNVNTNTPGSYTVVYTVTDSGGNTVTATRNVTVQASNNGGGSSGGGGGSASITELLGLLLLLSVVMSGRSRRLHRRST